MKTKKKILKIAALTLAIVLSLGVCMFANSLIGNPLSRALAKSTAKNYIEENYAGYELEDLSFSFKDGYYHALVSNEESIDSEFTLLINGFGKLKYDNYDYNVTNGWNTAKRLDLEYRRMIDGMFDSGTFPYNEHIGYGELIFVPSEQKDAPHTPSYALITEELTTDAYYNVSELGKRAGKLTVYIEDDTVSVERMAQILLGIRECFDEAGVSFYAIDCVLEYPLNADGSYEYGKVEVLDFLYSDIREDGLVERVDAANKAATFYYGLSEGDFE